MYHCNLNMDKENQLASSNQSCSQIPNIQNPNQPYSQIIPNLQVTKQLNPQPLHPQASNSQISFPQMLNKSTSKVSNQSLLPPTLIQPLPQVLNVLTVCYPFPQIPNQSSPRTSNSKPQQEQIPVQASPRTLNSKPQQQQIPNQPHLPDSKIRIIEQKLGYTFHDKHHLITSITHRSYSDKFNYEKYEFFGDSILLLISADVLCEFFLKLTRGELTSLQSKLVCNDTIGKFMKQLNIGEYLFTVGGKPNAGSKVWADIFEALVAAIYIDGGYERAKEFVTPFLRSELNNIANNL
ncbi:ribonuclease III [Histomonas meleagridis]|uniref:ribonuclease III n=1 Tax=Histomonas meleagridis TaxID=135588 RepID=UPI00355A48FC|nr:ribonuclease III [Histomonas meleagridis]KAH0805578.1 ribonuclease III [Histomonas meleagridis]